MGVLSDDGSSGPARRRALFLRLQELDHNTLNAQLEAGLPSSEQGETGGVLRDCGVMIVA